jgi:beta-1,4-mannosyl-glycoprotein beta-1,4-N-acetylglucosaminyltransferase
MDSFVDKFILVESNKTHQGEKKEYIFQKNINRFEKWNNKIIYIKTSLSDKLDAWSREHYMRQALNDTVNNFPSGTIIMHGDLDEIVSKDIGHNLGGLIDGKRLFSLDQTFYSMAVDWKYPDTWQGTVIAKKSSSKDLSMLDLRNQRVTAPRIRGGWHFSWLGGPTYIEKKARSFAHTEDKVQSYIREMGARLYTEGYHVLKEKLIPVEVDDSYPEYIRNRLCPQEWFRPGA